MGAADTTERLTSGCRGRRRRAACGSRASAAGECSSVGLAPIFVTLGAWLLWRARVTRLFLGALVMTLAGAVLLVGPNVQLGGRTLLGDALGVLTAMFYAGYMLALKSATGTASTAEATAQRQVANPPYLVLAG